MKSIFRNLALASSLMLVGAAAHADWIDAKDFGNTEISGFLTTFSYQHDINDDGFNAATDVITGYELSIDLFDDDRNLEAAVITVGEFDLFDNLGNWVINLGGTETGWSISGKTQLQASGLLDVSVTSLFGDFYLRSSTLKAYGHSGNSTSVPEPATLGLLGLGLLGVGFAARRRKT